MCIKSITLTFFVKYCADKQTLLSTKYKQFYYTFVIWIDNSIKPGLICHMREKLMSCLVCGNTSLQPILSSCDYKTFVDTEEYHLSKCSSCNFVELVDRPTQQSIGIYYPSDYYSYNTKGDVILKIKYFLRNITSFLPFLESKVLANDCLLRPKIDQEAIIDIGCGDGEALEQLGRLGWKNLWGTEINSEVCKVLQERGMRAICTDDFTQVDFEKNKFDVARMFHVLEHVTDPKQAVQKVHDILNPGGHFLIGVPNFDSLIRSIFGRYFFALQLPTHFSHFSTTTIKKLLEENGFTVKSIKTIGLLGIASSILIVLKVKYGVQPNTILYLLLIIITLPFSLLFVLLNSGPVMNIVAVKN